MIGGSLFEKHFMKNLHNNISDVVQSQAIRHGSLETIVPEVYTLRECIEINPWHDHQSVFDHTTACLAAFEQYLDELSFSPSSHDIRLSEYLLEHVYGISHADEVRLALLFHDIAKPSTIETDAQGHTACLHHELHGALVAAKRARAFGISHGAARVVSQLVLMHGTIHNVVNAAIKNQNKQPDVYQAFESVVVDLHIPLLLVSRFDAQGSDLPTLSAGDWNVRRESIDCAIELFSRAL
jgi:UTP:GlnB (protein PII) uridylyltransferase